MLSTVHAEIAIRPYVGVATISGIPLPTMEVSGAPGTGWMLTEVRKVHYAKTTASIDKHSNEKPSSQLPSRRAASRERGRTDHRPPTPRGLGHPTRREPPSLCFDRSGRVLDILTISSGYDICTCAPAPTGLR